VYIGKRRILHASTPALVSARSEIRAAGDPRRQAGRARGSCRTLSAHLMVHDCAADGPFQPARTLNAERTLRHSRMSKLGTLRIERHAGDAGLIRLAELQ
jgi:hypothetical protein